METGTEIGTRIKKQSTQGDISIQITAYLTSEVGRVVLQGVRAALQIRAGMRRLEARAGPTTRGRGARDGRREGGSATAAFRWGSTIDWEECTGENRESQMELGA